LPRPYPSQPPQKHCSKQQHLPDIDPTPEIKTTNSRAAPSIQPQGENILKTASSLELSGNMYVLRGSSTAYTLAAPILQLLLYSSCSCSPVAQVLKLLLYSNRYPLTVPVPRYLLLYSSCSSPPTTFLLPTLLS